MDGGMIRGSAVSRIDIVRRHVCEAFDVTAQELLSESRQRSHTVPRFVAIRLARDITGLSFPILGRRFGGRDHTTIMNAYERAGELLKESHALRQTAERLRLAIEAEIRVHHVIDSDPEIPVLVDLVADHLRDAVKQRLRAMIDMDGPTLLAALIPQLAPTAAEPATGAADMLHVKQEEDQ